jgi:hypothetical protein
MLRLGLAVQAGAGLLIACTPFEEGDDLLGPAGAGGTTATAALMGERWSCMGETAAPFVVDESRRFTYSVRMESLLGGVPPGLTVRACRAVDVGCVSPIVESLAANAEGYLEVPAYWGFDGFLEANADGHLPALFYVRQPVFSDVAEARPFQLFPIELIAGLAAANQAMARPDLAIVLTTVSDCSGLRAPGVRVGNNLGGIGFYFASGLPSVSATESDAQGAGGAVNVPPGLVQMWAEIGATGQRIGQRTVNLRGGWAHVVNLPPPVFLGPR